jgi:hypothetical protein
MIVSQKIRLMAALLLVIGAGMARAENAVFTMHVPTVDESPQVQIIGGSKADPAQWPMTFVFANPAGGGCTSTAVGERTVITAAHCIPNGAIGIVEIGNRRIRTVCTHHPDYRTESGDQPGWEARASPDFALCALSEALPGGLLERIDVDGKSIAKGRQVHLVGFGCNQPGGADGAFGVLFEGDSEIDAVPVAPNYYTYTRGAAVCYGDSGGAAYQFQGAGNARRLLVAINSRGNISTISLLSTTKESGFIAWARNWATANGKEICGIHSTATGCRPQ